MTETGLVVHRDAAVTQRKPARHPHPVTVLRVLPEDWRLAMELAENDVRRLEIESATTVAVHNQPRRSG